MRVPQKNNIPKSILIYREDKIGDAIVSSHFFKSLKESYPESKLTVGLPSFTHNLYQGSDYIDAIIDAKEIAHLTSHYDWAICLQSPTKHIKGLSKLNAERTFARYYYDRVLLSLAIPFWLTDPIKFPKKLLSLYVHEVEYYAYMAQKMHVTTNLSNPYPVAVNRKEREAGKALCRQLDPHAKILFHCGIRWLEDGWNKSDLIHLIKSIHQQYPVLCTYGPAERELVKELKEDLPEVSFLTDLSLQEWAGCMEYFPLMISCDTGAIHLASATQIPIIASFGHFRYHRIMRQWQPLYTPNICLRRVEPSGHITAISTAVRNFFQQDASLFSTKIPNIDHFQDLI